jgi:hypothetical protein
MIGAAGYQNGSGQGAEGGAFLWLGGPSGLGENGFFSNDGATTNADWKCESNQNGAWMGTSVAAGDVNHDGFSDIFVGAPRYNGTSFDEGCAFGWFGGAGGLGDNGMPGNADWIKCGSNSHERAGQSIGVLDTKGDGYQDVLVGSPANGISFPGHACLYVGSVAGLSNAPTWCGSNNNQDDQFGYAVAGAGDVNGDRRTDAIIGAPFYDNPEFNEGAAYLFYGMPSITDSDGDGLASSQGDCDDANAQVWMTPGEVRDLMLAHDAIVGTTARLSWQPPLTVGAVSNTYDTLVSTNVGDFVSSASCLESDGGDTTSVDPIVPVPGTARFYLIRAENGCPGLMGNGPLGKGSNGIARLGRDCP